MTASESSDSLRILINDREVTDGNSRANSANPQDFQKKPLVQEQSLRDFQKDEDEYMDMQWWNDSIKLQHKRQPSIRDDQKPLAHNQTPSHGNVQKPLQSQKPKSHTTYGDAQKIAKKMDKMKKDKTVSALLDANADKIRQVKEEKIQAVNNAFPRGLGNLVNGYAATPVEPILVKTEERFQLLPLHRPEVWKMVNKTRQLAWKASQYKYEDDRKSFNTLTPAEKHLIINVECFFANSDLIVGENIVTNFIQRIQSPEWRVLYTEQLAIENVHAESYSLQLNALIEDTTERMKYFKAMQTIPVVRAKDAWMLANFEHNDNFAECVLTALCSEHIFFSSSFAVIYWFKSRNLLPVICNANEEIARDESMHVDTGVYMWNKELKYLPTVERTHQRIREAVELECSFVHEALGRLNETADITVETMCKYVKFMADRLCSMIHVPPIFDVPDCPLRYMVMIGLQGKSNLHERVGNDYRRF
jgi:ribonucleotide reductase beta subunit family protein with ferritin-like domain